MTNKKDKDIHVVRITPTKAKSINTKGIFYYEDDDGYTLLDNREGKHILKKLNNFNIKL